MTNMKSSAGKKSPKSPRNENKDRSGLLNNNNKNNNKNNNNNNNNNNNKNNNNNNNDHDHDDDDDNKRINDKGLELTKYK